MGESHFAELPSTVNGGVLLAAAIAYWLLQQCTIATDGHDSRLRHAIGSDWKGKASPLLYVLGIALTFVNPALSRAAYVAAALMWLVPDRCIERSLHGETLQRRPTSACIVVETFILAEHRAGTVECALGPRGTKGILSAAHCAAIKRYSMCREHR